MYYAIFPRKSKTKNHLVKSGVNGTQGTILFSKEREKQKITHSKLELTMLMVQCFFQRKGNPENSSVESSINGTHCTMLFFQEGENKESLIRK